MKQKSSELATDNINPVLIKCREIIKNKIVGKLCSYYGEDLIFVLAVDVFGQTIVIAGILVSSRNIRTQRWDLQWTSLDSILRTYVEIRKPNTY